jgi:hypothetical protein
MGVTENPLSESRWWVRYFAKARVRTFENRQEAAQPHEQILLMKCGESAFQKRSNLYLFLDRTFVGPSSFASWTEPGRRYSTP